MTLNGIMLFLTTHVPNADRKYGFERLYLSIWLFIEAKTNWIIRKLYGLRIGSRKPILVCCFFKSNDLLGYIHFKLFSQIKWRIVWYYNHSWRSSQEQPLSISSMSQLPGGQFTSHKSSNSTKKLRFGDYYSTLMFNKRLYSISNSSRVSVLTYETGLEFSRSNLRSSCLNLHSSG